MTKESLMELDKEIKSLTDELIALIDHYCEMDDRLHELTSKRMNILRDQIAMMNGNNVTH